MTKLGLRVPVESSDYSLQDTVDVSVLAEELGFTALFVAEGSGRNGFMLLGQIASATNDITISSGIVNIYSRTPSLLAMSAATLDEISNGRAFLGIAPSSKPLIENWHSISYDQPLRRIKETIEIVKKAWRRDRIDYDGDVFQINDYPVQFETVQNEIPIFNAALREHNRNLTGEYADGWLPTHTPLDSLPAFINDVKSAAQNAGRDPGEITIAPYIVSCVSEDAEYARRIASKALAYKIGAMDYYAGWYRELGYEDEVSTIRDEWAVDKSNAYKEVPESLLNQVTISGTPEEGRELLKTYREIGVDIPVLRPPSIAPVELVKETIRELGQHC
jgi:alkanesulfonate monooxygenase SsuD/methylene tetrahydromethanopterin reductase-like flavin-dependent oxidoreductase (luciferase family)